MTAYTGCCTSVPSHSVSRVLRCHTSVCVVAVVDGVLADGSVVVS